MSTGIIGTTRPADIAIQDISIYYSYVPNRQTLSNVIFPLDATQILSYNFLPTAEQISGNENLLEGLYNIKLPASTFNQIGIYTLYLKPKTITTVIVDCSVLSSLPTINGIVLDTTSLPSNLISANALQGYKIEYINSDGTKLRNVVRYITTSNKVVPISENVGNTSQKSIRYRFDDSGTLLFLQLTPSSASNVQPNAIPFIGNPGQTILLSNTSFTPLAIEIELVNNDLDSIFNIIAGNQTKDVQNGILTIYDSQNVITNQYDLFEIKDSVGSVPLFEVKQARTQIDSSEDFNTIISGISNV